MRKGVLEYCILSILNHKEAYASNILDELKKVNMLVVEGTLYPLLPLGGIHPGSSPQVLYDYRPGSGAVGRNGCGLAGNGSMYRNS